MAKVGLKDFLYAKLTESEDGGATYGEAKKPGKAISCKVNVSTNSASLYADDVLAESDISFQSGTATIGVDDDDLETQADLLGHEYSTEDGIIRNSNDIAPYVGLSRIITKIKDGVKGYKVEFIKKVKFGEPSQDDATRGQSLEFGTVELEGAISTLKDGTWSRAKTFKTYEEAVQFQKSLFKPVG